MAKPAAFLLVCQGFLVSREAEATQLARRVVAQLHTQRKRSGTHIAKGTGSGATVPGLES